MRKNTWLVLFLAMATGLAATSAGAQLRRPTLFSARLVGSAEQPNPVESFSVGTATIRLDRKGHKMHVSVNVNRITDLVAAHIHIGGTSVAGPVVVQLYGPAEPAGREGGFLFSKTVTSGDVQGIGPEGMPKETAMAALIDEMIAGNTYINLHTVAHPSGEIRGQIRARAVR